MKQIDKRKAKKLFYEGKEFGMLSCNLRPGMIWQPCWIEPKKYWENTAIIRRVWHQGWNPSDATKEIKDAAWESVYNNFCYYNCDNELGYYPHYYVR